jgi:hypothetical protein
VVSAGPFYKADVVIVGGDLTGKAVVPIVRHNDGSCLSKFQGREYVLRSEESLAEHEKLIMNSGFYFHEMTLKEMEGLSKSDQDHIFKRKIMERLSDWIYLAEDRLKNSHAKVIVAPGNDDFFEIDSLLERSSVITQAEGKIIDIDDAHEMINSGWSNPTPWNTPRECSEDELLDRITAMTSKLEKPENSIFNLHAPPYDSGLDAAPELDKDLKPVSAGQKMIPVGSVAVRKSIESCQPLLGLHGHIHEARGAFKIGRTLCVNPGSNYSEGILTGVMVDLDKDRVVSNVFTSG